MFEKKGECKNCGHTILKQGKIWIHASQSPAQNGEVISREKKGRAVIKCMEHGCKCYNPEPIAS